MKIRSGILAFSLFLMPFVQAAEHAPLNAGHVGVYAQAFDWCTMNVVKLRYDGETANPDRLAACREALAKARARGQVNVVGLYTFDRVKHSRPVEEYVTNTLTVLGALDLDDVHAVFLSEENVTWNNGLALLNTLYDSIKSEHPDLPVYQWLTSPAGPHPKLKADGWVYDLYDRGGSSFRNKIAEYLVTGTPLIMCLNTSPSVALCDDPRGAKLTRDQFDTCLEFNIPTFYFCVDSKWGNPYIWHHSNDPQITPWRTFLLGLVDEARTEDISNLPRLSADYVDGQSIEAGPDENGLFTHSISFDSLDFLRRGTIRGFRNITWNGLDETLIIQRRSAQVSEVNLFYHITSDFELTGLKATLDGETLAADLTAPELLLSATGHNWPHSAVGKADSGKWSLEAAAGDDPKFRGQEYWVRIRMDADKSGMGPAALLRQLTMQCRMTPPDAPGVHLTPDRHGNVSFEDSFDSAKSRWLARIENEKELEWNAGAIGTHGVKGRSNRVAMVWPVDCGGELETMKAELEGRGNTRSLGSRNTFGASLDGKDMLLTACTTDLEADKKHGWQRGTLKLDLGADERFHGVRTFYLHAVMTNGCGVKTNTSNTVTQLRVTGTVEPTDKSD